MIALADRATGRAGTGDWVCGRADRGTGLVGETAGDTGPTLIRSNRSIRSRRPARSHRSVLSLGAYYLLIRLIDIAPCFPIRMETNSHGHKNAGPGQL